MRQADATLHLVVTSPSVTRGYLITRSVLGSTQHTVRFEPTVLVLENSKAVQVLKDAVQLRSLYGVKLDGTMTADAD
jgi:hypothetical protein